MTEKDRPKIEDGAEQSPVDMLAPVRYSLPRMLAEIERDRESVREGGKLLNQDQIGAVFETHRQKGHDA